MNDLQIFKSDEFGQVRTVEIANEPWFVGKDVAEILGYSDTNKAVAMHVDEDDKKFNDKTSSSFGQRGATLINESGLYAMVISSKLPTAKQFKRWVTSEVLPSIRKTGKYAVPHDSYMIEDPVKRALAWVEEEKVRQAQAIALEAAKPKALFADAVASSSTSILVRDLAKVLHQNGIKIGQNRMFDWLREHGYLIKSGSDKNMPTQKAMELKLFRIKEGTYIDSNGNNVTTKTPKITGKGQIYFVNKFLNTVETAKDLISE